MKVLINNPLKLNRLLWLSVVMFVMFVMLIVAFVLFVQAQKQIDQAIELRLQSYLLANELRQSSDDLSHMVRNYVSSGNSIYKQYCQEILDIREGKKPRPHNDNGFYWDIVLAEGKQAVDAESKAISLLELMRQAGFTEQEFAKLSEAKNYYDQLIELEFNAIKQVESDPSSESNRSKASHLLEDEQFHQAKGLVLRPIQQFYQLMELRTQNAVEARVTAAWQLCLVFIVFSFLLMVFLQSMARRLALSNQQAKQYALDLEKSHNRFYAIIQQSPFSIQIFSPEGNTLQVNAAWEKLWGVKAEDIIGYNILQDRQLLEKGIMPYIVKGFAGEAAEIPPIIYNPALNADYAGPVSANWVRSFIYPVKEAGGAICELILFHEDISNRKFQELQIQRLSKMYAALAQTNRVARHAQSEKQLFSAVCRIAVEDGGIKMAWIGINPKDTDRILPVACFGENIEYLDNITLSVNPNIPEGCGASGKALREGRAQVVQNFHDNSDHQPWHYRSQQTGNWGAIASFPIFCNGKPYAVFALYHAENNIFDELHVNLLEAMAADISVTLDNLAKENARQIAMIALTESEARYRALTNLIPDQIWTARPDGCLDYFNQRALDFAGLPTESLINQGWLQLVHHEDLNYTIERWSTCLQTGQPYEMEFRLLNHAGVYRWCQAKALPYLDINGQICKWYGVNNDISERKQASEALKKSEIILKTILESSLDGIVVADAETSRFIYFNPAICQMLGYSREQFAALSVKDVHYAQDMPRVEAEIATLIQNHVALILDLPMKHQDGSIVFVDNSASIIYLSGKLHIMGVFRDVSKRHQLELHLQQAKQQAEHLARIKGEFLANMSHEIRTPLNAIIGLAKMGSRSRNLPNSEQSFTRIQQAGLHLLNVVNEILDFSKIESGKMVLDYQTFNLPKNLNEALSLVELRAKEKLLSLELELEEGLPEWVIGDALRLRQILVNLLSNAIKFTDRGFVKLKVLRQQANTHFIISDSGIGISPEHLERLFSAFEQGDSSSTRKFGGSGLGLVISKNLANLMGGDISVNSVVNKGSQFTLIMPLIYSDYVGETLVVGNLVAGRLPGIRVLAADDVYLNRLVLEDLLLEEGAYVVFAENGQQLIDIYKDYAGGFDVVLMDIQMPVVDGYQATRSLLEIAPDLPIIGLTAHVMPEERQLCLDAGMCDRVTKPIDANELVKAILQVCKTHSGYVKDIEFAQEFSAGNYLSLSGEQLWSLENTGLHLLLNSLAEAAYGIDSQGKCIFVNQALLTMLDYQQASELLGQFIHALIHHSYPDGSPYPQQQCKVLNTCFSCKQVVESEEVFWTKHGKPVSVEYRASPIVFQGKVFGVITTFVDISERLKYQQALQESESKAQTIAQQLALQKFALDQHAIVATTDVTGSITYVNDKFCQISGYSRQELLGANHRIIKSGFHDRSFFSDMYRTISNGWVWHGEICNQAKGGCLYWVDTTIVPAMGENGKPEQYIAIRADITKRKENEFALVQYQNNLEQLVEQKTWQLLDSERRIQTIFASLQDLIWLKDKDGVYLACNPMFERFFGASEAEILGKTDYDFVDKQLADAFRANDILAMEAKKALSNEEWITFADNGEQILLDTVKTPIYHQDGQLLGVLGVGRDITQRKLAEEATKAANQAKSDFLANMSHEIRTPIHAVLGMTQLALRNNPNPCQLNYLTKIQQAGTHLLGIINEILDFSKIEAGHMQIVAVEFALDQLLNEVRQMLELKVAEKKLDFNITVSQDVPNFLLADGQRILQVLLNFANNAVKFTPSGAINISVSLLERHQQHLVIRFVISDTGIGIPAEFQSRIYSSFAQADSSITRQYGGTGLGLAICKQLTQLMGGEVGVSSQQGGGCCFWFTVPVMEIAELKIITHQDINSTTDQQKNVELSGRHILIVEDNVFNQLIAQEILSNFGVIVTLANNGQEALDYIKTHHFDCVLMDMQMPVLDGLKATQLIRAIPGMQNLLIIAMTANAGSEDQNHCLEAGMNDFISKPISIDALYARLSVWLMTSSVASSHLSPISSPNMLSGDIAPNPLKEPLELLNKDLLLALGNGNAERRQKYVNIFLKSAQQSLDELQLCLQDGDVLAASRLGHKLKPSTLLVGALSMNQLCQELELITDSAQLDHTRVIATQLSMLFLQVKDAIEIELNHS